MPDATRSRLPGLPGLSPKLRPPDQDECERGLVIELVTAKKVLKRGQPVSINYKMVNKSKSLTAEFDVYFSPYKPLAYSAFSEATGERVSAVRTGLPKVLGVSKQGFLSPGESREGTFRLDEELDFSKPGLYRIVGNQHFAVFDEAIPSLVRPFMKFSNPLIITISE